MSTALVTTAWLDNDEYWKKTLKFLNYYDGCFDTMNVLDNGSVKGHGFWHSNIYKQFPHYSRTSHLSYLYLWRACYSLKSFLDMPGVDRVIYMDNDFFIISPEMRDWAMSVKGWVSPWCSKHNFPETGLQIVTKDCEEYIKFVENGKFWTHDGKTMETTLTLTEVRKGLIGDRWPEYGIKEQQSGWDFIAQTPLEMDIEYGK